MDALIEQIRRRAADLARAADFVYGGKTPPPPATAEQIAAAETVIGRPLPTFLRRLYQEVANGGIGPDYGLLGLDGGPTDEEGRDAVSLYRAYRRPDPDDPFWEWPESLLPVGRCGCGMYLCVDCSTPDGRVSLFDPNPHEDDEPWDSSFMPLGCGVEELFAAWMKGRSWTEEFAPE